ncbi:MAG: hypothetical protein MJZ94_02230 [Bacteroidales bacterium]|nr:hypothetical protein [Bacteroidales bacterium]
MINGFERETAPLSTYEEETLLPIMIKCLELKRGKENAVTNKVMCERMKEYGYNIDETKVRKIINHIRINYLIDCLMATSKGYYISDDPKEIHDYIQSLKSREEAIRSVRLAIEEQAERNNLI